MTVSAEELAQVKKQLEAAKQEQLKAEIEYDNYARQLKELDLQIKELGFEPSELKEEIDKLSETADKLFSKLKELIQEFNNS